MIGVAGQILDERAQALCLQMREQLPPIPYAPAHSSTDHLAAQNWTWWRGTRFRIDTHPHLHGVYLVQWMTRQTWTLRGQALRSHLQVTLPCLVKCGPGAVANIARLAPARPDTVSPLGLPWEIAQLDDPIALEGAVAAWLACGNTLLFTLNGDRA